MKKFRRVIAKYINEHKPDAILLARKYNPAIRQNEVTDREIVKTFISNLKVKNQQFITELADKLLQYGIVKENNIKSLSNDKLNASGIKLGDILIGALSGVVGVISSQNNNKTTEEEEKLLKQMEEERRKKEEEEKRKKMTLYIIGGVVIIGGIIAAVVLTRKK